MPLDLKARNVSAFNFFVFTLDKTFEKRSTRLPFYWGRRVKAFGTHLEDIDFGFIFFCWMEITLLPVFQICLTLACRVMHNMN